MKKVAQTFGLLLYFPNNLPKQSIGENSPNLVTLLKRQNWTCLEEKNTRSKEIESDVETDRRAPKTGACLKSLKPVFSKKLSTFQLRRQQEPTCLRTKQKSYAVNLRL
jgi:hypothetical protein